jgi:hypothetical protein
LGCTDFQQVEISAAIVIAEEHSLAPVAALGDMMGEVGHNQTSDASHPETLQKWA